MSPLCRNRGPRLARGHFDISARHLRTSYGHFQRVAKWRPRNDLWWYLGVTGLRKKPVVLLAAVALSSGVLVVGWIQSAGNGTESGKAEPKPRPAQLSQSGAETNSLFARDPNFATKSSYSVGRQEFFVRTMLAVVFVIVLGAAAIYVSKKLLPKIANRPSKEIRIVETVHLGPRKAVHLIEVGKRRFLIGSTNESIRELAEVTAGFPDLSEQDIDLGSERI